MVRKPNKTTEKKSRSRTSAKPASPKARKTSAATKVKGISVPARGAAQFTGLTDVLSASRLAICLFDKDDNISWCTDGFAALIGLTKEELIGLKMEKNAFSGGKDKDPLYDLYAAAKESREPCAVESMQLAGADGSRGPWSVNLLPQMEDGAVAGMLLAIEEVPPGALMAAGADLFHRFYAAASQLTEAQPLLDELVRALKDFSRCDSVRIVIVHDAHNRILKAESGIKPGLRDKDVQLSAPTVSAFFARKAGQTRDLFTPGGSLYLDDVNALEDRLTNALKEMVVDFCNSHGFCRLALVPVRSGDSIIGFIQLANKKKAIAPDTIAAVEMISDQLQLAFDRLDLKAELRVQREGLLKQMHARGSHLEALSERLKQEAAERKKVQEELQVRKDLAVALASLERMEDALQLCLDTAIRVSGMDSGWIGTPEAALSAVHMIRSVGFSNSYLAGLTEREPQAALPSFLRESNPRYFPDDVRTEDMAGLDAEGVTAMAFVPIIHQGDAMAWLAIASHTLEAVPHTARDALEAVASEVGATISRIRDREALAESEGRYGVVFAQSMSPILVVDEEGNYRDANEAALKFLECTREELLHMNVRDTLPPYLDEKWLEDYKKVWATGGRVERDFYVWGKIKVLELTITPFQIGGRRIVIGLGTDITERKRLEHELRMSEERHRSILDQMQDSCYETDLAGRYTYVNDAMCRGLWYTREELIGKRYRLVVPEEDVDRVYQAFYRVYETGQPNVGFAHKIRRKDGAMGMAESSITLLKNERGEPTGFLCIGRDITARTRLEAAAKRAEEKYRDILEEMDEAYVECDSKGTLTFVNDAACRQLGYERDELLGMNYKKFSSTEDIHERIRLFSKVYQTGEPVYWWPTQMIRKDGSRIDVENSVFPLKDETGETVGLRVVRRNVTEQKRMESALRQSEQRYRDILEEMNDSYIEGDLAGTVTFFNDAACRNLGYTREEFAGINYRAFTSPEMQKEVYRVYSEVLRTGVPVYWHPFIYVTKQGGRSFIESSVFPMRNEKGEIIGNRTLSRNVTEKKLAADELNRRAQMLDSAYDSIIVFDPEGTIIYANERAYQTRGYGPGELIGMNIRQLIPGDAVDNLEQRLAQIVERGELEFVVTHIRKDGSVFPVEGRSRLINVGGDQIIVSGYTDITLRNRAEAALVESESKYRSLVESGGASIAVVDLEGKFAFVNETLCRLTGYSREELLGKEFLKFVLPDERERDAALWAEAVGQGKRDIHIEVRVLHKDGHVIWLYTSPVELKILDKVVGFSVILQDITERKKAEERAERLNLILQAISLVNQLIVREKDRDRLLQQTCESLVSTRGFKGASVLLLNGSASFLSFSHSGLDAGGREAVEGFVEELKRGNLPTCVRRALEQEGPVLITSQASGCEDCSLLSVDGGNQIICARLRYGEETYGALSVFLPESIVPDEEEMKLVEEVAGDIAYSLYNIELEQDRVRWEKALHESEEHFRSLAEESPSMIFIHDLHRVVYANKLCEEIMGYSREELYAEDFDFLGLVSPDYMDSLRESFQAHREGVEVPQREYVFAKKDGTLMDALLNTKLIVYANRPAILGVVTDVTDMRRIERALSETEDKYRVILEEANEAYLEIDERGNLTFANDAACRHLGYSRDELVGLNYKDITVPEDRRGRVETWGEVFRTGVPRHRVEYRNIRKDGSMYYAECSIFPLHDREGRIVGLRTVAQDITRRRQAEEELRLSEEKYRTILDEMDETYVEVDLKGNVTFANEALSRKLGYTTQEFVGMNYKQYTPPDQIREKASVYSEVVRTGNPVYWHPFRNIRKDGQIAYSEVCIFPVRNDRGEITGLRTVTRDVTQARLAESELEKRAMLLDSAYDAIVAYDQLGNIIYANEQACRMYGYLQDELLKMNRVDLSAESDLGPLDARILGLLEKGHLEFEAVQKRRDGSTFPVNGRSTIVDIGGQPVIVAAYTDITERNAMQKAVVESESKYRSLVESGAAGIATTDLSGHIEFVNDTLCDMVGYAKEEIVGRSFMDFIHADDLERIKLAYSSALESGRAGFSVEFRAPHKDGHLLWLSTTPAERYSDGKVVGFSVITQDITSRKQAEDTARRSEEKYGTILEEIDEHYAEVDARGNFTFVNEAMCRGFGYTREEMIGMNFRVYTPPEFVQHRLDVFRRVFKTGRPTYWQLFEDIIKDGSRRLVEISVFPLKDASGQVVGLRTIGRDVTDRRQAEAKLRKSEERYRLLAENSLDVIFTTDTDLRLNYISPSVKYLLGIPWDEILQASRESKLTSEFLGISERDARRFQQCLEGMRTDPTRTEVFEFPVKHRNGYVNWAEVQMSTMRDKSGQPAGTLGVIRDISQQKKMTERLISADRLASLGEMAAGLAHEVNNPLTAVMGFSYLLLQNPETPEDVRNDVEAIYKEGKRAAEIIRNFLTFARGQKPEKQAVYINDILQEVLRLRRNQMEKQNIEVVLSLAEDLPAIQGDVSQLQQVFLNIILNAEYFMYRTNKRGLLQVTTRLDGAKLIAEIADDGPGIHPDALSRIFDPFYTTKDVGEGTGLGLSICHGIVMEHGGTITAESEPGKGAILTVELPVK